MWTYNYSDELYHHGVLGMKWGHHTGAVREGNRAYREGVKNSIAADKASEKKVTVREANNNARKAGASSRGKAKAAVNSSKKVKVSDVQKKNIDTGTQIAVNLLAMYGAYKLAENAFGSNYNY